MKICMFEMICDLLRARLKSENSGWIEIITKLDYLCTYRQNVMHYLLLLQAQDIYVYIEKCTYTNYQNSAMDPGNKNEYSQRMDSS